MKQELQGPTFSRGTVVESIVDLPDRVVDHIYRKHEISVGDRGVIVGEAPLDTYLYGSPAYLVRFGRRRTPDIMLSVNLRLGSTSRRTPKGRA